MKNHPITHPIKPSQAVLFVAHCGELVESITVFVPYSPTRPEWAKSSEWYASRYDSTFGPVDIAYSWGPTYRLFDRKNSAFHVGKILPGESFQIMERKAALKKADALYSEATVSK